ncbi:recombinase RecT [Oceanobacillus sp. 1P07AA]|uniref:recombinase RecT n=1 Tax=Oceanobacillus sp. 1P07AA TaxID=3132293 RepID=UPI0039A64A30
MTNKNQVAVLQKDITDDVNNSLTRLQDDGLKLPTSYNASNALKSAFFKLREVKDKNGKPALEVCSRESVANSLLDMVVQGLSPAKTQCYFVVYGTQLQMTRSYFGTQAVLKRLTNVKDIWANVIFEGDEFDYEIDGGREKLLKHNTKFQNRDNKVIGAYAVVKTNEDEELLTVMTKKEIDSAWGQSKTKQSVHQKFPQEMAKRTVINRAAKAFINTSDDSDLLVEAINNSTENEYDNSRVDVTPEEEAQQQITEHANSESLDIDDGEEFTEYTDVDEEQEEQEPVTTSSSGGPDF